MFLDTMLSRHGLVEQYELHPRTSEDSTSPTPSSRHSPHRSEISKWLIWHLRATRYARILYAKVYRQRDLRRKSLRSFFWLFYYYYSPLSPLYSYPFSPILRPSCSRLPDHYLALGRRCKNSGEPGRGNPNSENIFIAASLCDPVVALVEGYLGRTVLELVELLGLQNAYLSVCEDDADSQAKAALDSMKSKAQGQ